MEFTKFSAEFVKFFRGKLWALLIRAYYELDMSSRGTAVQ